MARDRVWAALLDTETLRAAIPGCESVTAEGEGRFAVSVVAAVGPVKARFKGRLQQQDPQPPVANGVEPAQEERFLVCMSKHSWMEKKKSKVFRNVLQEDIHAIQSVTKMAMFL